MCEEKCKLTNIENDLQGHLTQCTKNMLYYVFETKRTTYYDKCGKEKVYSRTTQVNKEASLAELINQLTSSCGYYVRHRFSVSNEKYYWKLFCSTSKFHTIWMDYSLNIEFAEKIQTQSAHYSGRQQTCHCSLIEGPTGKMYVYHMNTNHDSIMTFTIIRDLIERYPAIITDERLVLHSDNASSQYKCRYTFYEMRKLAMEKI